MGSLDTVSNKAVITVLRCLGLPPYEYHKHDISYRDNKYPGFHGGLHWSGLSWMVYQYNSLLKDEVRPYFQNKFDRKRMDKALKCSRVYIPQGLTLEQKRAFILSHTE